MSVRSQTGHYFSVAGNPASTTSWTKYGIAKINSDLGASIQLLAAISNNGGDGTAQAGYWDATANDMTVASVLPGPTVKASATLGSRPPVGDWFAWYLKSVGGTLTFGFYNLTTPTAWVSASCAALDGTEATSFNAVEFTSNSNPADADLAAWCCANGDVSEANILADLSSIHTLGNFADVFAFRVKNTATISEMTGSGATVVSQGGTLSDGDPYIWPGARVAQVYQFAVDVSALTLPGAVTWVAEDWAHVAVWGPDCFVKLEDAAGNVFTFIASQIEAGIPTRVHHFRGPITVPGATTLTASFYSDAGLTTPVSIANRQMVVNRLVGVNAYQAHGEATDTGSNPTSPASATPTTQPGLASMIGVNYQSGTLTARTVNGWSDDAFITGSGGGSSLDGRVQSKRFTSTSALSGDFGNVSFDMSVSVLALFTEGAAALPPVITQDLYSQTVADGRSLTLSITALDATSYQWFDDSSGSFAAISGATSSSYTFTTSLAATGRKFYCVATNTNGDDTSRTAIVWVVGVPLMRTQYERLPRGGDDVWNQPQASVILQNDVFGAAATSGTALKVWNGSAHVVKPLSYWTGAAWAAKPLKRWDGSAWV